MDDGHSTQEKDYSQVIQVLFENQVSIPGFITALLTEKRFKKHLLTRDLLENAKAVIEHLLCHKCLPEDARDAACAFVEPIYAREIQALADKGDWHFGAHRAVPADIEDFGLDDMANDYTKAAPRVWSLLDALLKARKRKMSLLLQPVPSAVPGNLDELSGPANRDEERLEGSNHQRNLAYPSQEQNEDSEKRGGMLLKIV